MHTTRRSFLTLSAAAGLLLATPAAATATRAGFTLPRPSGPHPVGVRQRHLVQHGRADPWRPEVERELMISIWYPAHPCDHPRAPYLDPLVARKYTTDGVLGLPPNEVDWTAPTVTARRNAPANGRHPLVVYAPGGGNSRALGTLLVEDLASHGYVVVTVDHTHETPVEFPGGRLVDSAIPDDPPDLEAAKRLYMDAREADVHFVLDRLRDEPAADLRRIGLFGHSAGGVIATRVMRADRRVAAGANLDGFFEFGENHPERGVDRPFLLMGAAAHPEYPPLYGAVHPPERPRLGDVLERVDGLAIGPGRAEGPPLHLHGRAVVPTAAERRPDGPRRHGRPARRARPARHPPVPVRHPAQGPVTPAAETPGRDGGQMTPLARNRERAATVA